jgi:hypothetical protein
VFGPVGGVPVAVALFAYSPEIAVPLASQVMDSRGARVAFGQRTAVGSSSSSTTVTSSATSPVLVTWYCQVTSAPSVIAGPGAVVEAMPLVSFSTLMDGCEPK